MNLIKNTIQIDISEIEKCNFPLDEVFELKITNYETVYCFIIRLSSKSKKILCFGPGAQSRNAKSSNCKLITPPFFHRWSWYGEFDESFIAYADPTFFKDDLITLGWFVGDKQEWYLETLANIIKKILSKQKIKNEDALFFGSSGGGFASICLGTLIKNSKVLINNSQFFILNFEQYHINNLFRLLKKSFDEECGEIIQRINYRLDVIHLFKKEKYIPHICYYGNIYSKSDLNNQLFPFLTQLSELDFFDNDVDIHLYCGYKKVPHDPMGKQQTIKIIKSFIDENLM